MLKGIDPLIGSELLAVLAQMGHGDEIAVADANFPAASVARATPHGRPIRMDVSATRAVEAILTLLPLDTFDGDPVHTMQIVGDAATVPEAVAEGGKLIAREGFAMASLERFAFYERSRRCYAVVHTLDTRLYANFILRKGVIGG
ncbi:MAG: RbsD/FucU family protein [Pseudorhodobacter sp.]